MRLIDADALLAHHDLTEYLLGWLGLRNVKAIIEHLPTIEAVPVVRGEWIRMDETQALLSVEWKCSQCGQEICVNGILTAIGAGWKYCPNCGADMRGREVKE